MPARPTSDGRFWGVLPVPEPDNHQAEVYASVVAANGVPLAQSRVIQRAGARPTAACSSERAERRRQHLIVGETSLGQKFRKVAWWQCDGIRERVDVRGERRDDEACLPIAWWERPEMLGAAGAGHRRRHPVAVPPRCRRWGPRRVVGIQPSEGPGDRLALGGAVTLPATSRRSRG